MNFPVFSVAIFIFPMQVQAHNTSFKSVVNKKANSDFQQPEYHNHVHTRGKQRSKPSTAQNVEETIKHLKFKMSQIQKMMLKKSHQNDKLAPNMTKVSSIEKFYLRKTAPFDHHHGQSPYSIKSEKMPNRCHELLAKAGEVIKKSQNISERLHMNQSQLLQVPKDNYNSFFNTSQTNISFSAPSYSYSPSFKKDNSLKNTQFLKTHCLSQGEKITKNKKNLVKSQIEDASASELIGFSALQSLETQSKNILNKNSTNLNDNFQFLKQLGRGKFGQVYLGRHIQTGFLVAIKKVSKQNLINYNMVQRFSQEIYLHSKLDHPNIVKFYGFYEEKDYICLVLQYLSGGTLFDFQNDKGTFSIKEATGFLRELISALTYLHDMHIAHRDLKPENIVLSSTGMAKLCDFGWSTVVQSLRTTFCGTLDYASPEILEKKHYDWSVDVWCLGILTYELLIGHAPFQNQDRQKVMQGIINVDKTELPGLGNLPQQAQEFIKALLQKEPQSRPKITELLDFPLFNEGKKPKRFQ